MQTASRWVSRDGTAVYWRIVGFGVFSPLAERVAMMLTAFLTGLEFFVTFYNNLCQILDCVEGMARSG
jgi:hypothetical protein